MGSTSSSWLQVGSTVGTGDARLAISTARISGRLLGSGSMSPMCILINWSVVLSLSWVVTVQRGLEMCLLFFTSLMEVLSLSSIALMSHVHGAEEDGA